MADQECNNIISSLPLALSSSTATWWDLHHHATPPTSSSTTAPWNNNTATATCAAAAMSLWETTTNKNSNSSPFCDHEDISVSASNHSSLTFDESSHRFVEPSSSSNNVVIGEPSTDNNNSHLWSQLLLGTVGGSSQEMHDETGENLLNAFSLKSFSGGIFESDSACSDYLKKLESHYHNKWIDNSFEKQHSFNSNDGYNGDDNLMENDDHGRSSVKLSPSNLVNSWSIAPPDHSYMIPHLVSHPCNNISSIDQYLHPDIISDQVKQNLVCQPQYEIIPGARNSGFDHGTYGLDQMRLENGNHVGLDQASLFPKASINNEAIDRLNGANWSSGDNNLYSQHAISPSVIENFNNSRTRLLSKPLLKSLNLLDTKKLGSLNSSSIYKSNGRGQGGSNEGKNRRPEDSSQINSSSKKSKHENGSASPSTASSSAKTNTSQTPKVKIAAEKISALQPIVSPYGKTDTASVLQEAILFIRSHQEHVHLLTNPYLKSNANKLQEAWGSSDSRKYNKGEKNKVADLKSKGLCLVPTSSIPQAFKDSSGPDYCPPYSYRGIFR